MATSEAKKKIMRAYAKKAVRTMLKWAQEEYKLDEKFLDATIIVSFAENRSCSYGGWHKNRAGDWRPYINLRLNDCLDFEPQLQNEYEHYRKDPEIGAKRVVTWKAWVRFEAAHEVSHVIEHSDAFIKPKQNRRLERKFGRSKSTDDHSKRFQKIYRVIRNKFVNRIRSTK
jgi:hypothetical protein